jgi:hypothetical protein
MANSTNYLTIFARTMGLIADEAEMKQPELYSQYVIALETLWLGLGKTPAEVTADPVLSRIDGLLADCKKPAANWDDNWRKAWQAEQLMTAYLDEEVLAASAGKKLFDAEKQKVPTSAFFSTKWKEASAETDPQKRLAARRPVYSALLADLHWNYGKQSLHRKIRAQMSRTVRFLAVILIFFAVMPFLPWFGDRVVGSLLFSTDGASPLGHFYGLYAACFFGLLGALFSRLSAFQASYATLEYDSLINLFQKNALYIRLLFGMIGSLIIFYAIMGNLLGGQLFPVLDHLTFTPKEKPNGDFAKLVIWCFLGGFSERLVPDFLIRTEVSAAKSA